MSFIRSGSTVSLCLNTKVRLDVSAGVASVSPTTETETGDVPTLASYYHDEINEFSIILHRALVL